ncbi:hypothetical protein AKJ16_DCAP11724 [Drosera capensis]
MGSFKGHVVPGILFYMVGIWHMWCSAYRYAMNPSGFRLRVWNPVPGFGGRLKYLELYMVTSGAFIDLCIELLYATHLKFFVNGESNPSHLNNFEHSGMLVMFFIFSIIAFLSQKTRNDALNSHARKEDLKMTRPAALSEPGRSIAFAGDVNDALGYPHLLSQMPKSFKGRQDEYMNEMEESEQHRLMELRVRSSNHAIFCEI